MSEHATPYVGPPVATPYAPPPPPTITLALALDEAAVVCNLVVPVNATRVWLWRAGPSGESAYVRGIVDLHVIPPTTLQLFDFEAPFGVPLTYATTAGNDAGEINTGSNSATITLTSSSTDDPWLVDVGNPNNSQPITVAALAELAYTVPVGVHKVIGRRAPIVLSDVAGYPSFELDFSTSSDAERELARASLGQGIPLLLKTPPEQGVGNVWLSVLSWAEQRPSRIAMAPDRRFNVKAQQVERPDPALVVPVTSIATYLDVREGYADYAQVKAQRSSYEALMLTYAGEGGTVVPWPPTDV
jgi:hypothetical protein